MKSIQDKIKALVNKLSLRGEAYDTIAHQLIRRGLMLLDYKQGVIVEANDHNGLRITGPNDGYEARIVPTGDGAVSQLIGLLGVERVAGEAQAWTITFDQDGNGFSVEEVLADVTGDQVKTVLIEARDTFDGYAHNHLAKEPPQVEKAQRNVEMAEKCSQALGLPYTPPESVLLAPREPQESDSGAPAPETPADHVYNAVAAIRATVRDLIDDEDFVIVNDEIGHRFEAIDQLLDRVMLVTDTDIPTYIRTKAEGARSVAKKNIAGAAVDFGHYATMLDTLAEEIEKGLHQAPEDAYKAMGELIAEIAANNVTTGWWQDANVDLRDCPYTLHVVMGKLALGHSEISEAVEGWRKSQKGGVILMDDHLPERPMMEVEIADTLIRLFDIAGNVRFPNGRVLDVPGAVREKLAYNAIRPDHKKEAREAEGGKAA